ncbi:14167_t:CDS:2 [Funneliformis geosporum]|nr:14167_t:CDS:2 [Funneliformis geosporum]
MITEVINNVTVYKFSEDVVDEIPFPGMPIYKKMNNCSQIFRPCKLIVIGQSIIPLLKGVKELQDCLTSLEMFLKEYVIDVEYLEKSEKMDPK